MSQPEPAAPAAFGALDAEIGTVVDTIGVGRVALSRGALPVVLVVRCESDAECVLLHADDPSLADAARRHEVVALQVDDLSGGTDGHSLLLTGVLAPGAPGTAVLRPMIVTRSELHLGPPVKGTNVTAAYPDVHG